jgi:hypothetical protein
VEKLGKLNSTQTWQLTLRRLVRLPETSQIKLQWWAEDFDAVVIATGPYVSPHVPDIEGIVEWSKASDSAGHYSIYHSHAYRHPERYQNKVAPSPMFGDPCSNPTDHSCRWGVCFCVGDFARHRTVCAAGYRECQGQQFRQRVSISMLTAQQPHDNLHPFQLRSLQRFPTGTEFVPEVARFAPLDTSHRGIKHGVVHLVNGTELRGIDEVCVVSKLVVETISNMHIKVILATGFVHSNVFLPNL